MNEDKIIQMLLEHSKKFEKIEKTMATKNDSASITTTLDKLVALAEKKDQEVTLPSHGLRQVEDTVEKHDRILTQLAPNLMN